MHIKQNIINRLNSISASPWSVTKRRVISALGFGVDTDSRAIRKLRGQYCGRRAFVIGNGPSLRMSDLDKLKGEVSFASNKINLAFKSTDWRPTYHFLESPSIVKTMDGFSSFGSQVFASHEVGDVAELPRDTIFYIRDFNTNPNWPSFQMRPIGHCFSGYSTLYSCLQIAYYLGIREVYLLGVDHSYTPGKKTGEKAGNTNLYENNGEQNHFSTDYHRKGQMWTDPDLKYQNASFQRAKDVYEQSGGVIYNATRGGKLDVFARVDFDSLF